MKAITYNGKSFKGTEGNEFKDTVSSHSRCISMLSALRKGSEREANAKLFAGSKNLLAKAIKHIKFHTEETKAELDEAINNCL